MNPNTQVLVRWRNEGAKIEHGRAQMRARGDQDVMAWCEAEGLIGAGRCVLVGLATDIPELAGDVDAGNATQHNQDE